MRSLLRRALGALAKRAVTRRCDVNIAATSKVNFRGMQAHPPGKLSVGAGSTFEGVILSDRPASEVIIGSNTFIGNSTIVTAQRVEFGSDVLVSWGCTFVDHDSHSIRWGERRHDVKEFARGVKNWEHVKVAPIMVRDKAWIGFNVIVLKGVTIGEGAVVAAASVVTRNVPDYTLVAGNPARVLKSVRDDR